MNYKKDMNIDIVFCIDGTYSMKNCINNIKKTIKELYISIVENYNYIGRPVSSLRIKVIVFRDYECDEKPMEISEFFTLPEDTQKLEDFIDRIEAVEGGDDPENGLEALYYAFTSDFITEPGTKQIIVLFTDTDAIELLKREYSPSYPKDMVDMQGLINIWRNEEEKYKLKTNAKKLFIFAPESSMYNDFINDLSDEDHYGSAYLFPIEEYYRLEELDSDSIVRLIIQNLHN